MPVKSLAVAGFCLALLAPLNTLAALPAAPAVAAPSCVAAARFIPPRAATAQGGSDFARGLAADDGPQREAAIRRELLGGNLPGFLRELKPTTLAAQLPGGRTVKLTLCVLSDYLSIGSDRDFLRVPMSLGNALTVAARFGFTLPTRRMVDLIYGQAGLQLAPQPLPPGDAMRSTAYLLRHEALVASQMAQRGAAAGVLTAGHKKDLVLSPRLWREPDRVAIYGWHRSALAPIQPLSTVHGAAYADYSHGVRLVGRTVWLDGVAMSIFDLLADPALAGLLSDEGPLPQAAALLAEAAAPDR
ncbi:MAG: hypothetical protein C0505_15815 [Leptothrix sp. (in: Bacteria)]|nr:hypothetical protein [Leptothrix sp. (in: b-proteobacteria)]